MWSIYGRRLWEAMRPEGEGHLANQWDLIVRLKTFHLPTEEAEALLETFEDLQRQHEGHFVLIEAKDTTAPGGA